MIWIYERTKISQSGNDAPVVCAKMICDTFAELPAVNYSQDFTLGIGSEAHVIENDADYEMKSEGTWVRSYPNKIQVDMSGYYTSAQTDSAISTALTNYYTQAQTDAAIAAANYFVRGTQIVATSDAHFNVKGITTKGAWYFGQSLVQYMDNMPASYPVQGGQIRVVENQGTNRFIMELTSNSVAASGKVWRCWYTSGGWGDWYLFEGTLDV